MKGYYAKMKSWLHVLLLFSKICLKLFGSKAMMKKIYSKSIKETYNSSLNSEIYTLMNLFIVREE